jgi:GNAT superfamily N-acetyltransferase
MILIRRAELGDLEAVLDLRIRMLRELDNVADESQLLALVEANRRYLAEKLPSRQFLSWIAQVEGQVVAAGGLVPFERPPLIGNLAGLEGYVMNMYTLPAWRGRGLATRLLNEIIRYVKEQGGRRLWLRATEAGRGIYEKAGFVADGSHPHGSPTVEMELVLGENKRKMQQKMKDPWQCPKCGEKFVTPHMWHSCGQHSLEALFARSEPHVLRLYQRFEELVKACGPVTVIPQKTRVVFQVRVRFAGAVPRKSHLQCSFGFSRRRDHPRFYKIEQYAPRWYGHYCRIEKEEELDDEFESWVREAYEVGQQKHLVQESGG